jgi:hypothetical protein
MRRLSMRTLALAALLASSAGAQVMAGATSGVTARLALWLLVTVAAAGAAGLVSSPAETKKADTITVNCGGSSKKTLR